MAFPRGDFALGEGEAPPGGKRKQSTTPADEEEVVLLGRQRRRTKTHQEPQHAAQKEEVEAATKREWTTRKGARPLGFRSYHSQVEALGVVRSASDKHVIVSLPGSLAGHAAVSSCKVAVGDVVSCAVKGTRLFGKAKRVDVALEPPRCRLDDVLNSGAVFGKVSSDEGRGFVVGIGVPGATGFLPKKNVEDAAVVVPGSLRFFFLLRKKTVRVPESWSCLARRKMRRSPRRRSGRSLRCGRGFWWTARCRRPSPTARRSCASATSPAWSTPTTLL
mmetsp:Transcript_17833/g.54508  ORF Transcript_17833/g.54508 Transcript_17833/m.54508 type:complete len:276 (+) Transcript_17833:78-905(+)